MKFRGHCLVWHERVPDWFAALSDRAAAVKALEEHVSRILEHPNNPSGIANVTDMRGDLVKALNRLIDERVNARINARLAQQQQIEAQNVQRNDPSRKPL